MPTSRPLPPPDADQPLSVSDALERSQEQWLAGRLLLADGPRLADAYRSVPLAWADGGGGDAADGSLITVRGRFSDGGIASAVLLSQQPNVGGQPFESDWSRVHGVQAAHLRKRAAVLAEIRRFFAAGDYLEVETPLAVVSPGLDVHLDAFAVSAPAGGGSNGSSQRFLSTSPEYQMKRLLSAGLPRIFQLARCFRHGECGRRHNPEFSMLEWYSAYSGVEAMMEQTERLVRRVFELQHHAAGALVAGVCDVREPFARISVAQAFARYAAIEADEMQRLAMEDEERFFRLLIERVEPALAQLGVPVFLHDYPACQASLARLRPDDATTAERFELYVGDWELCNGFGELTDPAQQRARLVADQAARRALGKPVYPIDERFLAALEQGMPSAAGNALGVDRLVALCLDCDDIDQVMTFSDRRL